MSQFTPPLDPLLIGLVGSAGAGKDTVADHLCSAHGFVRYAFAQPLKNMLDTLLSDLGIPSTFATDRRLKELPMPVLGLSYRHMAQALGTQWGRALDPELWTRCAQAALGLPHAPVHDRIVITDCRFPNEAAWLRQHRGQLWRIQRPQVAPVRAHESEGHVAALPCDDEIDNSGSLAGLYDRVDAALEHLLAPRPGSPA